MENRLHPSEAMSPDAVSAATAAWLEQCQQDDPSQNLIVRGLLAAGVVSRDATSLAIDIAANPEHAELQAPFVSGYCEGARWLVSQVTGGQRG